TQTAASPLEQVDVRSSDLARVVVGDETDVDRLSGGTLAPQRRGACGARSVAVTPLLKRGEDHPQFLAGRAQVVAVAMPASRHLVRPLTQDSRVDQCLQPRAEQVRRDAQ